MEIKWLNEASQQFLEGGYLLPGQTVEERLKVIGDRAEEILGIEGFSTKVQQYIANGWISLSTPIWSNFGTDRGLPISCFSSVAPDSVDGILSTVAEIGTMSKHGGGTGLYMGDVRPRGAEIRGNGTSNGTKSFLELFQTCTGVISQGSTRRGYLAAYIDIFHKDIEEWLNIRSEGDTIQHLTWGVCVPTNWLNEMKGGDEQKRKVWAKVIQKRFETGLPYIFFTDNANNGESTPEVYKGKDLIKASNLCAEIALPSNDEESFVCDLSSLNDLYYEEWKDTDCVEVVTFLLDAAMTEFIEKASNIKFFDRAVNFSKRHRALGIGRLGYHSFLQSKMVAFESLEARNWNIQIQKTIKEQAYAASEKLAQMFGECEVTKGTGRRNSTLIAIAPTTSSAFILGQVSQSIECWNSNYFIKDLAKGKFVIKNRYLESLLESLGKNTPDVWDSIKKNHGSVLHLDFLSDQQKRVFLTGKEVSQDEVILQASHRQKYIDQGQSLNLYIDSSKTAKDVNALMLKAHDLGLKSLYYQHNFNAAQLLTKELLTCASCE
jgi:ribonucleoside-diphosphate reductase alpha chain